MNRTDLPIDAMIKFETRAPMRSVRRGQSLIILWWAVGPFRKFPNPKRTNRHLDSRNQICSHERPLVKHQQKSLLGSNRKKTAVFSSHKRYCGGGPVARVSLHASGLSIIADSRSSTRIRSYMNFYWRRVESQEKLRSGSPNFGQDS